MRAHLTNINHCLVALGVGVLGFCASSHADEAPTTIAWEDLLPEGEIELVLQLQAEYIAQVQAQWASASQTPLSQMGSVPGGLPGAGEADPLTGETITEDPLAVDPLAGDPLAAIAEGGAMDYMPQLGTYNTVADIDGLTVRMPGYVVPFNYNKDSRYSEFLLVPYFGACLHTPPPPPNQIVYITAEDAPKVEKIWEPVWVEGVISAQRNDSDLGNAAYTLALSNFQYYYD